MKGTKKISFILITVSVVLYSTLCFAKDTDIYMGTGAGVQPNILIIFDNSISMNDEIPTRHYVMTDLYDGPYNRDKVYKSLNGYSWSLIYGASSSNLITDIPLACTVRNGLTLNHFATGRIALSTNPPYKCTSGSSYQLKTGNYLNYEDSGGDQERPKLEIAQEAIKGIIDGVGDVKMGLMIFNPAIYTSATLHDTYGNALDGNSHGGKITVDVKELTDTYPDPDDTTDPPTITHKTFLKRRIDQINPNAFTPLAETLYEAGLYFNGALSYFNKIDAVNYVNYSVKSPIEYGCQKNYVIFMTDGDPTKDDGFRPGDSCTGMSTTDPELHPHLFQTAVGDQIEVTGPYAGGPDGREPGGANVVHYYMGTSDWAGTDWLDDVAKYLYDRPAKPGCQNIVTYTIGFDVVPQHDLLGRAATQGGGKYKTAKDSVELVNAFQAIVQEIQDQTSSFVAPIVPVSRMEKETAGDKLYLALFQPNDNRMWSGNIKKFGVVQSGPNLGQIVDKNGTPALDDDQIIDSAVSYWSTEQDGSKVEKGGIGAAVKNQTSRTIYTFKETSTTCVLTHDDHRFNTTNITPSMLGLSDTTARDSLVAYIYGYDAYSENEEIGSRGPAYKRDWMLGSFLHSRPLVIHYAGSTPSYIFAGGNDGMLHAFRDDTGEEAWGFIPPDLLPSLQGVHGTNNIPFVDGSPKAYVNATYDTDGTIQSINEAILIFGERRGGNYYYALKVTNPAQPEFLWYIKGPDATPTKRVYRTSAGAIVTDTSTAYDQLGQSWSTPAIGRVACQTGDTNCTNGARWVAFIGGGYDTNQDYDPVTAGDTLGKAVYVVDVKDGSLVKRFSQSDSAYSTTMTYSIPSDVARVDTDGDGKVNRLYVGDMGGRMWRFDVEASDPASWSGRIIFTANPGGSEKRKIFYPPDVTLEVGYEMLFFGTGDREHPQDETVSNRFYAIKDKNLSGPNSILSETNTTYRLYDVTDDELQWTTTTADRKNEILALLNERYGWYIILGTGEKSLAVPVVFYGIVYFTTFSPEEGTDPCEAQFGTARMYALDYKTAMAVFNFDGVTGLTASDRSDEIGTAIPSGVIITFIEGTAVAYTGVGGGVDSPVLPNTKSIVPIYWRTVF